MEEKKETQQKPLDLEGAKNVIKILQDKYIGLQKQYKELRQELNEINLTVLRLNMLFKVIEYGSEFNSTFLESCKQEIEDLMTVSKEEEK